MKRVNDIAFNDYNSNAVTREIRKFVKQLMPLVERNNRLWDMFEEIGGQAVIDKLVDDFYFIMSTDPEARDCFATHSGKDIQESAHKLKYFLSGWLGGPQLYLEKFGHPRLRMRHAPFVIGQEEAQQWLYCMKKALEMSTIPKAVQEQMFGSFIQVAQMLIR